MNIFGREPVDLTDEAITAIADAVTAKNWLAEYGAAVLSVVRLSLVNRNVPVVLQDGLLTMGDNVYGVRETELRAVDWQRLASHTTMWALVEGERNGR